MSSHPVFAEIISAFGKPLAAPSANRFGRISPTTAQHVFDELGGRIPLIIDAGPTTHGIESTIVAVHDGKIDILRRGPITAEQLARVWQDRYRHGAEENFRARAITIALRAENAASSDRQRKFFFGESKPALRVAGVESD